MADETVGVNIDFNLNGQQSVDEYTRAIKALDGLKANGLSAYEVAVKKVEAATKAGQKTTETYTVKIKDAAKVQTEAVAAARAADVAYQKFANAMRKAGQDSDKLSQSQIKLAQNSQKLDQSQVKLATSALTIANAQQRAEQAAARLSLAQITLAERIRKANDAATIGKAKFEEYRKSVDAAGKGISSAGRGTAAAGVGVTAAVTAPVIAGTAGVVKNAIDFESSFAGVRKTVDATEQELNQLAQDFRNLSKEIPVSVNEINKIAESAGQLGVKTKDIRGFTRTMADLGVTTNLTSDEAATSLAQFANIIDNQAGPQFDRLGATIVELGNKGASTEKQIVEMGLRIAGAGKQVGLAESEILSIASSLASVGIEAEAGGSSISTVFIKLSEAVETGGQDLQNFAAVSGQSAASFKKQFQTDAAGAFTSFINGLGKIQKEGGNTFGILKTLDIAEIRQRDAVLRLAGAGNLLNEQLAIGSKAFQENTALTVEAEKRYATTASQLQILSNRFADFALTIGNAVLPIFNQFLSFLSSGVLPILESAANSFAGLSDPVKGFILGILGIAAAVGPILIVVGAVVAALGGLVVGITAIVASASTIGVILAIVAGLFITLLPSIISVGVAIATLATIWSNNIGGIQQKAVEAFTVIKEFIGSTLTQIQAEFQKILPLLQTATKNALDVIQSFWDLHGERIIAIIKIAYNVIKTVVETGIAAIGGIIRLVLAVINGDWATAWKAFQDIVEAANRATLVILGAAVRLFIEILQGLLTQIFALSDKFYYAALDLGKRFLAGLVEAVTNPAAFIAAVIDMASNAVNQASDAFYAAGARAANYFTSGYSAGTKNLKPEQFDNRAGEELAFVGGGNRDNPVAAPAPPTIGGRTSLPKGFGGGKNKTAAQPNLDPIDALVRAQSEATRQAAESARAVQKANNELELKDLDFNYKQRNLTLTAYYDRVKRLREDNLRLEIEANAAADAKLTEAAERTIAKLGDSRLPAQDKDGRKRDELKAELATIAADKDALVVTRKQLEQERANVGAETSREELEALQALQNEYKATARAVAELTNNQRILNQIDNAEKFDEPINQARQLLASAETKVTEATAAGNVEAAKRYQILADQAAQQIKNLQVMQAQTELNRNQAAQTKTIAEIENRREVALEDLNKTLIENGTDGEESDRQRNALMLEYQSYINNVLETLKLIRAEANTGGLFTGDLDKVIRGVESGRKQVETKPFNPTGLTDARRAFLSAAVDRDQRLTDVENSGASNFEKEQARVAIIRETTAALLAQAEAWLAVAQAQPANTTGRNDEIDRAQQAVNEIKANTEEIQSSLDRVRNTAIDSFASGLNQLFLDIASGSKTAGQALLDFAGTFIQAVQQIIIQMIALAAVKAVLKAFGGFSEGGSFSGLGSGTSGTSAATGGYFSDLSRYAGGGDFAKAYTQAKAFQDRPLGMLSGPGTSKSDEILARVSNKEYIFDGETTRNMGVDLLDQIRYRRGKVNVAFAEGGAFSGIASAPGIGGATQSVPASNNLNMTNVNVIAHKDIARVVEDVMQSSRGETIILNHIRTSPGKTKAALEIG